MSQPPYVPDYSLLVRASRTAIFMAGVLWIVAGLMALTGIIGVVVFPPGLTLPLVGSAIMSAVMIAAVAAALKVLGHIGLAVEDVARNSFR